MRPTSPDRGPESTATVADAAAALGVAPGRIAKTLAVRAGDETFLLVARGDARLDNGKCKAEFGARPRMLGPEETLALTGHPVGGVCPFGLATPLPVYLDVSLRAFDLVYPAGGLAQRLGRGRARAPVRAGRDALGRSVHAVPRSHAGFARRHRNEREALQQPGGGLLEGS